MSAVGLLDGLRALDLTDEKGFVCGKFLGSMGMEVIKVEQPEQPARQRSDSRGVEGDYPAERDLVWRAFNTDKRSITLDIETQRGRELLLRLAADADFLIESFDPGHLDSLGLGIAALHAANPRLVVVSITHFGQHGPYRDHKGSELVDVALSGVLDNTGYADLPPVKESLNSAYFHAGIGAAFGALVAKHGVEHGGSPQRVDISIQEVAASRMTSAIIAWQFDRSKRKRGGNRAQFGPITSTWFWRCKDGFLFWYMLGGATGAPANKALSEWMDEVVEENPLRQVTDWRVFDKAGIPQEESDRFDEAIGEFFLRFTKEEVHEESLRRGVNATIVNDVADLLADEHLASREYWTTVEDPERGSVLMPRHFLLAAQSENHTTRPAPLRGEANREIYTDRLGLDREELDALRSSHVI